MINSLDFTEIIRNIVQDELRNQGGYKIGTVASTDGKPTILFAGESQPSQKQYSFLSSYTPKVGDRVLLAKLKGTYVVMGGLS